MAVFFHYLQSAHAKLYAKGELVRRELDTEVLAGHTMSRPPADLFHTFVLNETTMAQISHSEDVFMAKIGITVEGIEDVAGVVSEERLAVDDKFIAARLHSPSPHRFGFEVHSDDGKHIRAIVVETHDNRRIKTLMDAEKIVVTAYDAVVSDDGSIEYAEVYPAAIIVCPAVWAAPLTEEMKLHPEKVEQLPVEFMQFKFKYKSKPQIGPAADEVASKPARLPGLGGAALQPPSGFDTLAGLLKPNKLSLPNDMIGAEGIIDFDMFEVGQMCLDRFNEALMLLHVKGREPKVVQQVTEAPSGKMRALKKTGNRSGVHRINIDPVEFRVLVSKRAEHIKHAFENPNLAGYGVKGLAFYKRHKRRLPSGEVTEVSPYAKCDNDDVRIKATELLLKLEQYTDMGHEELKESTSIALARMIEEWGAAQTKARLLHGPISKVRIVEPSRNNPPVLESKTDHAP